MEIKVTICDNCLPEWARIAVGYYFDDTGNRRDVCLGCAKLLLADGGGQTVAFYRYPGNDVSGRWLFHPVIQRWQQGEID